MTTKKDRRHSGRKTVCNQDNDYPIEETKWDDWSDYRDGFRGSRDKTIIRKTGMGYCKRMGKNLDPKIKENNKKLKRYYIIRKARRKWITYRYVIIS